ncbi:MAG: hypothetical protein ACLFM1_11725 [Bacteroidales bacterium]
MINKLYRQHQLNTHLKYPENIIACPQRIVNEHNDFYSRIIKHYDLKARVIRHAIPNGLKLEFRHQ